MTLRLECQCSDHQPHVVPWHFWGQTGQCLSRTVGTAVSPRITSYFLCRKMQCKDQINIINIWSVNKWTACPFFPPENLKIKTHALYTMVMDGAQDVFPDPEKGQAHQTHISLEFLMFPWISDYPHGTSHRITTSLWDTVTLHLWSLAIWNQHQGC